MVNDPRDLEGKRLQAALMQLGRNPDVRNRLVELLKQIEDELQYEGSIRDDLTGPVVDALHDENDIYEKVLSDGTAFRFLYRTKIARDFYMARETALSHVWEPQTTKLLLDLASKSDGDVIVGGAYFGDQAILVAKQITASGRAVHCFEPGADQARMLRQNVELNHLENVRINRVGLWSEGNLRLRLDGFDSFANVVKADEGDDAFPTTTIDEYREATGSDIGLIQIDIEGAEFPALCGARETLKQQRPFVVFEVHRHYVDWTDGLENTQICKLLNEYGYTLFAVRDFNSHHDMGDKPVELIPVDKVYLEGPPHGFNMLAVVDVSTVMGSGYRIVEHVSPKLLAHKDPKLHHPADGL